MSDLPYLHAINILANAKLDALQNIADAFEGDWKKAWSANLTRYIPRDRDADGKLVAPDYVKLKKKINPEQEWDWLTKENIGIITINDKTYPKKLRHIHHPPYLLYIRGSAKALNTPCFGVVGTRALTEYGKRAVPHVLMDVARSGFTIVSGLAAGIDTLAHNTALEAGATTVAVLGTGIDDRTVFPAQNLNLARKIIENGGALITEYAPGTHGSKFTFPQRNRIVSGLSRGVLVVEADIPSGSMITAKYALEQNRDVFAIPGTIFAKMSEGTNALIKSGAKLVSSAEDILDEYGIELEKKKVTIKPANDEEARIIATLAADPLPVDEIVRQSGLEPSQVTATLVIMELSKKVRNLGNGKYVVYS